MAKIITDNPASVNQGELVSFVDEKYKEGDNQGLERQWYLNIAYLTGKQWIAWDGTQKKLYEPPKEWWEERMVSNQIMPNIRTELAKITKSKPMLEVIPQTNEDEDIATAKACTKLMDYLWRKLDMREKIFELALWFLTCGTAYIKTYWDPTQGDLIDTDDNGQEIFMGDIAVDVVSPFDLRFDKTAKKWHQVRWCIESKLRNVDYVEEKYGVKVDPEDGLVNTNVFEGMLSNLNGFQNDSNSAKVKDGVVVKEYWEIPSKKHPKGRHITVANNKLLQYEDNPYSRLPYHCFVHIRVPGRVHGRSVIEDLMPVQRFYNRIRSMRLENLNRMGNQRIIAPIGCLVNDPTNEPGEILEYNPGIGTPDFPAPPSEPGHVQAELENLLRDIENISGIHEVSKGSTPPGVKSGVAIAYLQEQDDTKLGPTIHTLENGIEKWAVFVLELVEANYLEPRLVKILGKNNQIEVIEFKGSDIKGNRDVVVVAGSALPQSKAARQEFILNLVDRGILADPQVILKLLEFGSIEEAFEEISIDINQAKSEHKRWSGGDYSPLVRDFYNHTVHVAEHNKYRKSDEYEQLPPEIQALIDEHVAQHMIYILPPVNPMEGGGANNVSPEVTRMPMEGGMQGMMGK